MIGQRSFELHYSIDDTIASKTWHTPGDASSSECHRYIERQWKRLLRNHPNAVCVSLIYSMAALTADYYR